VVYLGYLAKPTKKRESCMGHTQITLLTFGGMRCGTHDFFTHLRLVALTHVMVVHSLTTHRTRFLSLLYLGQRRHIERNNLAWCHRLEHKRLVVPLEGVLVGCTIMYGSCIELPLSSKKHVTHGHWHDITLDSVFIWANLEGDVDFVCDLEGTIVMKPFDEIWMRMLHVWQLEFLTKFSACKVVTTSSMITFMDLPSISACVWKMLRCWSSLGMECVVKTCAMTSDGLGSCSHRSVFSSCIVPSFAIVALVKALYSSSRTE